MRITFIVLGGRQQRPLLSSAIRRGWNPALQRQRAQRSASPRHGTVRLRPCGAVLGPCQRLSTAVVWRSSRGSSVRNRGCVQRNSRRHILRRSPERSLTAAPTSSTLPAPHAQPPCLRALGGAGQLRRRICKLSIRREAEVPVATLRRNGAASGELDVAAIPRRWIDMGTGRLKLDGLPRPALQETAAPRRRRYRQTFLHRSG